MSRRSSANDLIPVYVHRFDQAEIEAEMRDAGFRLARYEPEGRRQHDAGWAVGIAEPLSSSPHAATGDRPTAS